jgi:S-disulfanyl-L-cysteine oxidoreductase SoxD
MSRSRRFKLGKGSNAPAWAAALAIAFGILGAVELAAAPKSKPSAQTQPAPAAPKRLGIGRAATAEEVAGWDIDIRPDGHGLPAGKGSAKAGEPLYLERCAACHGEFGESAGRWPIVMGGAGSLASHDPVKSVGSYWPYASTLIDYIRRTMPFGNAQSLSNDELYAVTAYVLWLNDVIKDENFELNERNLSSIKLPNEPNFRDDDREITEREFWRKAPCMANCAPSEAAIIGRARALDVTPDSATAPKVE